MVLLPALKPACSSAMIFSRLRLQSAQYDLQQDFAWVTDETYCSVVLALLQVAFLGKYDDQGLGPRGWDHSPVCQILLQIVVRAVITSSPPAWTSCAWMLSTPADFPVMTELQPPLLCKVLVGRPLSLSGDSSLLMHLHWFCDCTAESSILSRTDRTVM